LCLLGAVTAIATNMALQSACAHYRLAAALLLTAAFLHVLHSC
jgi:hypothetical protein